MFLLAVLLCSLGSLAAEKREKVFYDLELAQSYFDDFVHEYDKTYNSDDEKQTRFEIFKENLKGINELNEKNKDGVYGITKFSDLTQEEVTEMYGYRPEGIEIQCVQGLSNTTGVAVPSFLDWRLSNIVTSVKEQSTCSACWTFAAAAAIEGQHALLHKQLIDLSEQQLLDCSKHAGGCSSGYYISNAILDTIPYGGIMAASDYPYENRVGQCRMMRNKIVAKVVGCRQFVVNTDEELKQVLYTMGPLAVGVSAVGWERYHGGLHDCVGTKMNHAALLVGYGIEGRSQYWLVKNSYGPKFGENGYIKLRMDPNACNIQGMVVSPIVQ